MKQKVITQLQESQSKLSGATRSFFENKSTSQEILRDLDEVIKSINRAQAMIEDKAR